MKDNQDQLNLLRKISSNKNQSQRDLAKELGFSLGKLNYCLKSLNEKGLVKIKNFKKNPNKLCLSFNTQGNKRKNKTYNQFYETQNERI